MAALFRNRFRNNEFEERRDEVREACPLPPLQERKRMKAIEKERLCNKLMLAVFPVFVGAPNTNINCFNKCVWECRHSDLLSAKSFSLWRGYGPLTHALHNSAKATRSRRGGGVYGCPRAELLVLALACFCVIDVFPRESVVLKQMLESRAVEHARTVVIHDKIAMPRQTFLWVKRGIMSAPEDKDGDEIESSADHGNKKADDDSSVTGNEGSGADNGSGITDIGSGGANGDSSSSTDGDSSS
ncbi:hypothetical protein J3F84DRAFT_352733 [Trichoderma pleuroticola]